MSKPRLPIGKSLKEVPALSIIYICLVLLLVSVSPVIRNLWWCFQSYSFKLGCILHYLLNDRSYSCSIFFRYVDKQLVMHLCLYSSVYSHLVKLTINLYCCSVYNSRC